MKTTLSKSEELAILDQAIAALGPDSYIGPWLASQRAAIETDIKSDFFPTSSLKDSVQQAADTAQAIIAQAQLDAQRITLDAERQAKESRAERDRILRSGWDRLNHACKVLEGYVH